MADNYSLAHLLYRLRFKEITPDIYSEMESLFKLYPREILNLLRYFNDNNNDIIAALSLKFLIDKEAITPLELHIAREMKNNKLFSFIYFYALYKSGDVRAIEEIEKCMSELNITQDILFIQIIAESSDCLISDKMRQCLMKKLAAVKNTSCIYYDIIKTYYDFFREHIIKKILDKTAYLIDDMYTILYMSISKNPICFRDLVYIYEKIDDKKIRNYIIECMENCLSLESVNFILKVIYTNKGMPRRLAFSSLVRIHNKLLNYECMGEDKIDLDEKQRIIDTIRQNENNLKQLAVDIIDNGNKLDFLSAFNILISLSDVKLCKDILDGNNCRDLIGGRVYKEILQGIVYKIISKENIKLVLEYIKTRDSKIIREIYKEVLPDRFINKRLYNFFANEIDGVLLKTLHLIKSYNIDIPSDYIYQVLDYDGLRIDTKLYALTIFLSTNKEKTIECLRSFINKKPEEDFAGLYLLFLYQADKELGINSAKDMINKVSSHQKSAFIDLLSPFIILLSQEDPSLIAYILEKADKIKHNAKHQWFNLLKYLDKDVILKSFAVIYNKNKDVGEIFKILKEPGISFIKVSDVLYYIYINQEKPCENDLAFLFINDHAKYLSEKNQDMDIAL